MDFDQNISKTMEGIDSVQNNITSHEENTPNNDEVILKEKSMPLSGEGDAPSKDLNNVSEISGNGDEKTNDETSNDLMKHCFEEASSDFTSELIENVNRDLNKDNLDVPSELDMPQDTDKVISDILDETQSSENKNSLDSNEKETETTDAVGTSEKLEDNSAEVEQSSNTEDVTDSTEKPGTIESPTEPSPKPIESSEIEEMKTEPIPAPELAPEHDQLMVTEDAEKLISTEDTEKPTATENIEEPIATKDEEKPTDSVTADSATETFTEADKEKLTEPSVEEPMDISQAPTPEDKSSEEISKDKEEQELDKEIPKISEENSENENKESREKPVEDGVERMDTSELLEDKEDAKKDEEASKKDEETSKKDEETSKKDEEASKDVVDSKLVENVDEVSNEAAPTKDSFDSLLDDGNTNESTKKSVDDERTMMSEGDDRSMEENPFFVHVSDSKNEDKNDTSTNNEQETPEEEAENINEEDPIGVMCAVQVDTPKDDSNDFDSNLEKQPMKVVEGNIIEDLVSGKGADEELCIIPDTEREISQEEKDAATAKAAAPKSPAKTSSKPEESTDKATEAPKEGSEAKKTTVECSTEAEKSNEVNHVEAADISELKITEIPDDDATEQLCPQCNAMKKCLFSIEAEKKTVFICSSECVESYKTENKPKPTNKVAEIKLRDMSSSMTNSTPSQPAVINKPFSRRCSQCAKEINDTVTDKILTWETMEFCNEGCLAKYQTKIGSNCANCEKSVAMSSLGKYCVRFGHDIRQFCCSLCLEEFKKGLKVCSYCQKDISADAGGFLAPIGDKGQFKDFCSQLCMENFDLMSNKNVTRSIPSELGVCSVCANEKQLAITFEKPDNKNKFCSEPCFVAFKFVNNVDPLQCDLCKKYFENENSAENSMHTESGVKNFCSKTCQNIHIISNRRIVPCSWCKVKKYNFDMIKKICPNGQVLNMCSLNCLSLFQVSVNAVSAKKLKCDYCQKMIQAQYHLTMSDATLRNFCSYQCLISFQNQFPTAPFTFGERPTPTTTVPIPTPTGPARKNYNYNRNGRHDQEQPLLITNVQSLANNDKQMRECGVQVSVPIAPVIKQQVIMRPTQRPQVKNKMTTVRPITKNVGIDCNPKMVNKEIQTDPQKEKVRIVPVPVPIYVPAPMHMFAKPIPVPVPFPIPVPVPIFIPTTRNSAAGIMKEIKKIQVKIPTDPFEAELLMMAEMVAGEKKIENTDSESEDDDHGGELDGGAAEAFSPEAVDTSNTFGEDMLQMALKMATELDEPAVDLEGALTANTITASQQQDQQQGGEENVDDPQPMHSHHQMMERQALRGRKRQIRSPRGGGNMMPSKRGRRMSSNVEIPMMPPPQPAPPPEPIEKPDANMCLKYTFGVNAWKQWVTTKNAELEKSSRRMKLFKNEILQLTADELNYSLCLFVKEVRKPNGTEYAPDTIYYLCLGIQQYLFENGRIDNIFTDPYYEKFTDCLDEVARKFSVLYNDSHYIVTRVEEEHLWESKQLGAHSPHVLLSTLMFFNTKHFNLTTVDEHMQLSFSHIMKHWKRNPNQPGTAKVPGSRNVLLRFYPPQSTLDNNTRKKKVYEQQENEENPLRCPVKLYEFYLSKCPESVKTRNDVFYLQPERSCVPDSPVWYSTMALGREALEKMLHRVKMVKEINVALLTS